MKHWPLFTKGMAEVALISMASVKIGIAFSHSPEIQKYKNKPIKKTVKSHKNYNFWPFISLQNVCKIAIAHRTPEKMRTHAHHTGVNSKKYK